MSEQDNNNRKEPDDLKWVVQRQQAKIKRLEGQLEYFKKRFRAARQAVKWLENRTRANWQDSFGT